MFRTSVLFIASFLLALPALRAGAEETAPAGATIGEHLARLNGSLQEIVTLLERQVEGDETNLLIKRVELSDRSLATKKDRLRRLREEAANLQEKELSLSGALEASEEQELAGTLEVDAAQQVMLDRMEARVKAVARRRQDIERELAVLENEVRLEEEDMEILESVLDERLGLR